MTQTKSNRSLPEEIIEEILSRLPVKTLVRFKSASKLLLNLITRPEFVKLHLHQSLLRNTSTILLHSSEVLFASFDFNHTQFPVVQLDIHPDVIKNYYPPRIIGICNGVVCYRNNKVYVLYNPATRAYKQVPIRAIRLGSSLSFYELEEEFAYDCISDDFKIFNFNKYFNGTEQTGFETYLYNLKDNSWSKIKSYPPLKHHIHVSSSRNANNFSLYWKTYNFDSRNTFVMRFDLSSHRYEEISLPIRVAYHRDISLGVLNGRLHMMEYGYGFNIWMLKDDNCWTRVFRCSDWKYKHCLTSDSLTDFSKFLPMLYAYTKDRRKIIVGDLQMFTKVICCDLESQTISVVQVLGLLEGVLYTAEPWVESLVPLA